jgi:hypothetical protein
MTESSRQHDRENFFKYMSADTVKIVLSNGQLRWSSPLLFNDPFDVPRDIAPGFTAEDIARASAEVLNEYLDNPPDDLSDFDETWAKVLTMARAGFPPELREILRAQINADMENLQDLEALQALRSHWKSVVPTLRILCLAESANNMAMWHHYADHYRGVVLGFKCNDETDNCFLVARPIEYLKAKPDVYTDSGLARLLCLKSLAAAEATRKLATETKSDDWSYEKEWRIVDYAEDADATQYWDRRFASEDLSHVYLGPLIEDQDRQDILLMASSYPNVRILDASIGLDRELHFHEIEV